jgi:predicted  nucleic acid-binding Zn-ribbon protein
MHQNLETLLEIQDLKTQRRELAEAGEREVQEQVFGLSVDDALHEIDAKIAEMEETLPAPMLSRYRRVAAPVIKGTCYGCFVAVPTAQASDADRNAEVRTCQNCGRFLYHVD